MRQIWQKAVAQIERGRDFATATIISVRGAWARNAGTRLLVMHDGTTVGTIGGGGFEYRVRDLSLRAIETKSSYRASLSLCGDDAESEDLICGGEADVLIEFVDHDDPVSRRIVHGLYKIAVENRAAYLITEVSIPENQWSSHPVRHALMDRGDFRVGGFPGCLQLIEALRGREMLKAAQVIELSGWEFPVFLEWIKSTGTVCIFGAGHVGIWVARFAALVEFRVVVIDDRDEFASKDKVTEADEVIVTTSFERVFEGFPVDEDSYVVIVTRGHAHDKTVLAQALRTRARYIGMIGSRRKIAVVFRQLLEEGVNAADLNRVRSPIGLDIGGETLQEIGLSIVAEMVRVRSGKAPVEKVEVVDLPDHAQRRPVASASPELADSAKE